MKKNTIKAFTLVEMLIVIVIIGILIASLMPRMQTAQGRARDVARKNDLSQIQTAIITSQQDKGEWPEQAAAAAGLSVGDNGTDLATNPQKLAKALADAGMTQVPTDPNGDNTFSGIGDGGSTAGRYGYMVTKRNSISNGGFVLMARTEVEGSSNWVVCDKSTGAGTCTVGDKDSLKNCGIFSSTSDLKDVKLCTKFTKSTGTSYACGNNESGECFYDDDAQLRYILVY